MPPRIDGTDWYTAVNTNPTYVPTTITGTVLDYATLITPGIVYNVDKYVKESELQEQLDKFAKELAKKIHKILVETKKIDITEDEFIELLKEDNNT